MQNQNQNQSRPQLQPMTLSVNDLHNIIRVCEAAIAVGEMTDKLFGLDTLIQTRAAASSIQAKCQVEIARQEMLARAAQEKAEADSKARVEAEAKRKTEEASKIVTPPEPTKE